MSQQRRVPPLPMFARVLIVMGVRACSIQGSVPRLPAAELLGYRLLFQEPHDLRGAALDALELFIFVYSSILGDVRLWVGPRRDIFSSRETSPHTLVGVLRHGLAPIHEDGVSDTRAGVSSTWLGVSST